MHLPQKQVQDFMAAIGQHVPDHVTLDTLKVQTLRRELMAEEWEELDDAIAKQDILAIADGLADLLVVVYGTAVAFGLDMEPIFNEVHRANMDKLGGPKRADGKQLKPEGWKPPNLKPIIESQS